VQIYWSISKLGRLESTPHPGIAANNRSIVDFLICNIKLSTLETLQTNIKKVHQSIKFGAFTSYQSNQHKDVL